MSSPTPRQKLYRFFVDLFYVVEEITYQFISSWHVAWHDFAYMAKQIKNIAQSWQLWFLSLVITIILLFQAASENPLNFWQWTTKTSEINSTIDIAFQYPQFVATGTEERIELAIQNTGNVGLTNVTVIMWSNDNLLRFNAGNTVKIDTLNPQETHFVALPFTVPQINERMIETFMRVSYSEDGSDTIIEPIVQSDRLPQIQANIWQRYWILLSNMPTVLDGFVRTLGVLGATILGILTLRGRLGELINSVLPSFLKTEEKDD